MSCIITVYNVFKTAMKLKLKVTVAYYEAKPNLLAGAAGFEPAKCDGQSVES